MEVVFEWPYKGDIVHFACSVDDWKQHTMYKGRDNFYYKVFLNYGKYEYKFIVDDVWCYDITKETIDNIFGSKNNIINVDENFKAINCDIIDELFYRFPDMK